MSKRFHFLKHLDLFGITITIFHKQQRAFYSRLGGFITIWFICCILTYAGWRVAALIKREGDVITMGSLYYNSLEE